MTNQTASKHTEWERVISGRTQEIRVRSGHRLGRLVATIVDGEVEEGRLIAAAPKMATAGKSLAQFLYTTRNPGEIPNDIKEAMRVFEAVQP